MTRARKELNICVETIGEVIVDGGDVLVESPEMVALQISVEQAKYVNILGYTAGDSCDQPTLPGIVLGVNDRTIGGINEDLRGMPTAISFPEYRGYRVFAAESSRYVLMVALIHDSVFELNSAADKEESPCETTRP